MISMYLQRLIISQISYFYWGFIFIFNYYLLSLIILFIIYNEIKFPTLIFSIHCQVTECWVSLLLVKGARKLWSRESWSSLLCPAQRETMVARVLALPSR